MIIRMTRQQCAVCQALQTPRCQQLLSAYDYRYTSKYMCKLQQLAAAQWALRTAARNRRTECCRCALYAVAEQCCTIIRMAHHHTYGSALEATQRPVL
jgi:hypothetical protein